MACVRALIACLLLFFASQGAYCAPVVVHLLNGLQVRGEVIAWNDDGIRLATADGESTIITFSDLLRVDLRPVDRVAETSTELALTDGSVIPAASIVIDQSVATAAVNLGADDEAVDWTFASGDVLWARLQVAGDIEPADQREIGRQWQELCNQPPRADVLVVRKPGTGTLQPIEGALGKVTPETVYFTLSDEMVEVSRNRVYGIIYYRPRLPDVGDATAVQTTSGQRLVVRSVALVEGELQLPRTESDVFRLPIESVASVDFSMGRLAFLSDIAPFRVEVTPPIVEPDGAVIEWWHPRRDQNFAGEPLTLAFPPDPERPSPGLPRFEKYGKGVAVRGPATVVYRLPSGYRRLVATVGVDPDLRGGRPVEWQLRSGAKTLATGIVDRQTPPSDVEIDIAGVREVTLVVNAAEEPGDLPAPMLGGPLVVQFCNARLLK